MKMLFSTLLYCSLIFCMTIDAQFTSQAGQDQFLHEHFFKNKHNGFFVDVGAHDGITFSNTHFFEKELGWQGICFEPVPAFFTKLTAARSCICINACVSNIEGVLPFIEITGCDEQLSGLASTFNKRLLGIVLNDIKTYGGTCTIKQLPSIRLNDVLAEHNVSTIDYLSIDTEGNEQIILESIDFDTFAIMVISVENNEGTNTAKDFLKTKGYEFVTRIHVDDIFYRPDLIHFIE